MGIEERIFQVTTLEANRMKSFTSTSDKEVITNLHLVVWLMLLQCGKSLFSSVILDLEVLVLKCQMDSCSSGFWHSKKQHKIFYTTIKSRNAPILIRNSNLLIFSTFQIDTNLFNIMQWGTGDTDISLTKIGKYKKIKEDNCFSLSQIETDKMLIQIF